MLTETVAGRTYDYSHSVGRGSQTGMGFSNPVAAAIGKDDVLFVVNRGSEGISNVAWNRTGYGARVSQIKLGANAGEEEFIGEFSKYGNGNGEFIWGSGVAADGQGNLFVVDEWLNRVTVFDKDGNVQMRWRNAERAETSPVDKTVTVLRVDDADGKPIEGFSLDACKPLEGDEIKKTVAWKSGSDLSRLAGKPVRLRIRLSGADLYSLQFGK